VKGSSTVTLRPGLSSPINLDVENSHSYAIDIVSIKMSAPLTTNMVGCPASWFTTAEYTGPARLRLRAGQHATSLSQLGVPSGQWPQVALRAAAPNACQTVGFSISYTATATKAL
jgi:hypothetical protein